MALPSAANYSHVVDSDDEHEIGSSPARKKPSQGFDLDNPSVTKCHWTSVVRRSLCAVSFILLALSGYLLSRSTSARESNQELRKAASLNLANISVLNQTDSRYLSIVSTESSNPEFTEDLPAELCWSSSIHGGSRISLNETRNSDQETLESRGKVAFRPGGVMVYGDGCKQCHVGQACSLYIAVQSPAHWIPASASASLQWDMMVTLRGPSLIHVRLTTLKAGSPGQSVILASYTPWDAGDYSMEFRVDGSNLNYTKDWNRLGQHVFAQIPVSVLQGSQPRDWLEQPQLDGANMDLSAVKSPCAHGIAGRWLAGSDATSQNGLTDLNTAIATTEKYRWAFFSCARASSLNDMLWGLWKAGVREVNVIGDSHMRGLIMHLWFMHTGTAHNMTLVKHGDISYTLNVTAPAPAGGVPAGGELVKQGIIRVNYNWLDGIYDNNVAGCSRRGKYSNHTSSYPAPSPTADVTVVGTGHWTFEFCSDGAVAYPHYLPHFLSSLHLLRPKKPAVFFGLPSFWVANRKWIRRTNAMLAYGNGIAQPLARHMGLSFFDTWQVTAPQYRTTCSLTDPHYSCSDGNGGMRGEVGEAVVKAFVYFLSAQLSKGTS